MILEAESFRAKTRQVAEKQKELLAAKTHPATRHTKNNTRFSLFPFGERSNTSCVPSSQTALAAVWL